MGFEFLQEVVLAVYEHDHVLQGELESRSHPALRQVLGHDQVLIFVVLVFLRL